MWCTLNNKNLMLESEADGAKRAGLLQNLDTSTTGRRDNICNASDVRSYWNFAAGCVTC